MRREREASCLRRRWLQWPKRECITSGSSVLCVAELTVWVEYCLSKAKGNLAPECLHLITFLPLKDTDMRLSFHKRRTLRRLVWNDGWYTTLCRVTWWVLPCSSVMLTTAEPTAWARMVCLLATLIRIGVVSVYTVVSREKSFTQWIVAPESTTQWYLRLGLDTGRSTTACTQQGQPVTSEEARRNREE